MGEEADYIIDQLLRGTDYGYEDEWEERPPKSATDVAEELLKDRNKMRKTKDINKGIIEW